MTQGRPRLKKAIADAYSPFFGKAINPDTEVSITTGANEGGELVVLTLGLADSRRHAECLYGLH